MEGDGSNIAQKIMESTQSTANANEGNTDDAPVSSKDDSKKRKKSSRLGEQRSMVWDHFTLLPKGPKDVDDYVVCNYCNKKYKHHSSGIGTSTLRDHITSRCKKYLLNLPDKNQSVLSFKSKMDTGEGGSSGHLGSWTFSVDACRRALAEMIIVDGLPFKFVENEGFKRFVNVLQPRFAKVPCQTIIARDCMSIYLEEKKVLKRTLKNQRLCLTTDTWTSVQNLNYMCLTAHYIDCDWKLQKKIINFCVVTNHKGETLGKVVESCLLEWGVDKFLTVTVDNASSNNLLIAWLKTRLKNRKTTILEHEFIHVRCCAHILNLVVCEGLKEIDESIVRVRKAVRYVKSSPSRLAKFKSYVSAEAIEYKGQLCLDVCTRWNSTYLMLEKATQFQRVFDRLALDNPDYVAYFQDESGKDNHGDGLGQMCMIDMDDWAKVRLFVKFLKIFYNATLRFSRSLHITANTAYLQILHIQNSISKLCKNQYSYLQVMAEGMRSKFDKYWQDVEKMNLLLLFALILDPRYKFESIKCAFENYYDAFTVERLENSVKEGMVHLYEWYVKNDTSFNVQETNRSETKKRQDDDGNEEEEENVHAMFASIFKNRLAEKDNVHSKSEFDRYLSDGCIENDSDLDLLGWWKANSTKYRILSQIARDVLAIPVSTVASESAFSTGGRVLDTYRSTLSPTTVEALICAHDWMRPSTTPIDLAQLDYKSKIIN